MSPLKNKTLLAEIYFIYKIRKFYLIKRNARLSIQLVLVYYFVFGMFLNEVLTNAGL